MSYLRCTPAIAILFIIALASLAVADGCMIAPWQLEIYETAQIAYLDYDADSGLEILHILPKFHGDTQNFAWIIPVPGLPELAESDADIFRELSNLTAAEYRYRDQGFGCEMFGNSISPGADEAGVEIIEEELVGIYQTMILGADNADALTDSLMAWGFLHDGNIDEVSAMLASYVDEEWYFVTLKVDSTAFGEAEPDWYDDYAMYPIELTFAVDAPVYPMRISAISAADDTSVTLYVKTDHRMDFDGAETRYANQLTRGEALALQANYPTLGQLFEEGDFLTKLVRNYTPEQMDADLYPEPADSNTEYRRIYYSGFPLSAALLLVMGAALLIRTRRR
jgi:hypothetical protein